MLGRLIMFALQYSVLSIFSENVYICCRYQIFIKILRNMTIKKSYSALNGLNIYKRLKLLVYYF